MTTPPDGSLFSMRLSENATDSGIIASDNLTSAVNVFGLVSASITFGGSANLTTVRPADGIAGQHIWPISYKTLLLVVFLICGVFGNVVAILTLMKHNFYKQTRQAFFLRCLLTNNLIALLGMFIQFTLNKVLSDEVRNENMQGFCISLVVWRYFGLSSGCVAFIMATDRFLSLTKPFYYQQHITMPDIKRAIIILWVVAAALTFMPLFGFGVYYDGNNNKCLRYRHADDPIDLIYAYLFFTFGILICIGIVICNIFVSRVLCMASVGRGKSLVNGCAENTKQLSSTERSFVKIIIALSISFVICWTPQMISIILAQIEVVNESATWFFNVADILMALHFGSDPYFYVLLRPKPRTYLTNMLRTSSSKAQSNSI